MSIDIREHGGAYGAGKYRKGKIISDLELSVDVTKGTGTKNWSISTTGSSNYQVGVTNNWAFYLYGSSGYKVSKDGSSSSQFVGSTGQLRYASSNGEYAAVSGDNGLIFFDSNLSMLWQKADSQYDYYTSETGVDMNSQGNVLSMTSRGTVNPDYGTSHLDDPSGNIIWRYNSEGDQPVGGVVFEDNTAMFLYGTSVIRYCDSTGNRVWVSSTIPYNSTVPNWGAMTKDSKKNAYLALTDNDGCHIIKFGVDGSEKKRVLVGSVTQTVTQFAIYGDKYILLGYQGNILKYDTELNLVASYLLAPGYTIQGLALDRTDITAYFLSSDKKFSSTVAQQFYILGE